MGVVSGFKRGMKGSTRPKFGEARGWYEKDPNTGMGGPEPSRPESVSPYVAPVPSYVQATTGRTTPTRPERRRARRAAETRRRSRAITRTRQSAAERKRQSAKTEKRVKQTEKAIKAKRYVPNPAKAIISSKPVAKPETFKGKPTAGTPTRRELRKAARAGTLKVNKAGSVTTPKVRKVGGELRRLQAKARSSSAPLPGLGPRETKVARKVLRTGKKMDATKKELLAAAETGLVESSFSNLPYGDADSEGWRQERTSIYGTGPQGPTNVGAAARRFYEESKSDTGGARGRGQTAGELAQTIQGSAHPERYDERKPEAHAIVKAFEKGSLKPAQQRKLAATKEKAAKLGLRAAQGSLGPAPKKVVTRFKAAQVAAKELEKAKLPYVWGGGHGDPASRPTGGGLDCSGAVSYVLNRIGAMKGSLVSGEMGSVLKPGPGAVTVFYNDGHTFMRIGDKYFGTSSSNPAGGAGFIDPPSQSYLSEYNVGHVPGLGKKQALQLNVSLPSGGQSFPGMTLSSSGTTATISGASATQSKPGFSKKPIRLSPRQKYRRTTRKLREAGVGSNEAPEETSATIKDLERRYGVRTAG